MTMYINDDTIEKVRETGDIVNVVSDYVPLKRSGANFVGLCPFHNEKTPSFTVSDTKQFFHCFGCGEGGDALTFIMKMENLSFPEAVKFLADKLGITIEEERPKNEKLIQQRNKGYEINREAARFFFSNLSKNQQALDYLYKRKINIQVIKKFGLGYSLDKWDDLYNYLSSKGYKEDEMEKLGLIGKRANGTGYYDRFRNRIIFPIIDTRGRVIGFGGRVLDETMPKYLNSQETLVFNKGNHLYGLNLVSKSSDRSKIILVEGYMDVIALFNRGIEYAVASLGTALTERQARLLKRYGENVYICYDSDQAGVKATSKAIEILQDADVKPRVITLGEYKDPDDFLKENSVQEFEKKIKEALNHIDYWIYINKQKYNIEDIESRIQFTIEVSKVIKRLKSPIEKDAYIDKIATDMNISKEAIQKEVFGNTSRSRANKNIRERTHISPIRTLLPSANLRAEIDLIKLMIIDKRYFDIISQEMPLEEYSSLGCREIIKIINELYREDEELDEKILFKRIGEIPNIDVQLMDDISKIKVNYLPENIEKMIYDLINTLKTNKLESKRNSIQKEIGELEKKEDKSPVEIERFLKLCTDLTDLNKELDLIKHEEGR